MITTVQFKTLDDLYKFYNEALFGGMLADCIVNMSRHNGTFGFFAAGRWMAEGKGEKNLAHEISLNPDYLDRPDIEWHATFVHEMVHLWQQDFGHPSRAAYHNKEWAWKMDEVGLVPSDTGEPGGKKTGQNMHHYINPAGAFKKTFERLTIETLEALRLKYLPAYPHPEPAKRRRRAVSGEDPEQGAAGVKEGGEEETIEIYTSKKKYTCPCGNNVWGKPGLNIVCGECAENFIAV
ncbi:MAG: SprT-like domain-containing protein [Treponema sp.]|nr:SprT-like domain-containing protein [Treponema sp.]